MYLWDLTELVIAERAVKGKTKSEQCQMVRQASCDCRLRSCFCCVFPFDVRQLRNV